MLRLKSSTSHLLCAFAAAISTVALPAGTAQSIVDAADSIQSIDGFTAHRIKDNETKIFDNFIILTRQKFSKDSDELTRKLDKCRLAQDCAPQLIDFMHMLDEVRADPNPLHKIMAINAWVNLSITYDAHENDWAHTDLMHESLLHTLLTGKGVCDEISELKLYALLHTGFGETDVFRLGISEYPLPISYEEAPDNPDHHAVAIARIGNEFWVLDFFTNPYRFSDKERTIIDAGAVEKLSSYINFSGQSRYSGTVKYPIIIFNDWWQYNLGTKEANLRNNATMQCLPAFDHLPTGILSATASTTVLAKPTTFPSLDRTYQLNAPFAATRYATIVHPPNLVNRSSDRPKFHACQSNGAKPTI